MAALKGKKMKNFDWGRELEIAYKCKTGRRRAVRLPATEQIEVNGERDGVTIAMTDKGVKANMQTNAAAFEAWALALRIWCEVEHIVLRWIAPQNDRGGPHYQRFLYRVERFRSLFPEWFRVEEPERLRSAEALGDGHLILNVARNRKEPGQPTKREACLELALLRSEKFRAHFNLERRDRQLPVGLFKNTIANCNRIFTGGKSAIDLIGVGGGTFWIFELKAGRNIPVGALSELLFYASVIRDAAGPHARFQFPIREPSQGTSVHASDIRYCARIEAALLGEQFHPLIDSQSVISHLNEAATRHWNSSPVHVPVHFTAMLIDGNGSGDYKFKDINPTAEPPG